jgi:predicted alpha/beta hydrolase family esterase
MSKNAIVFHGTGGNPDAVWYPWLDRQLTARGYRVERPYYPGLNVEPIATFLPKVLDGRRFDADSVLVGHSGGAALLLAVLEHLQTPVAQTILVAGYATTPNDADEPVLQDVYDWDRIRSNAGDLYFINSITDPYGCDATQGRMMFEKLGGTQIVRDEGHFGDYNQPYDTFELVDRLIMPRQPDHIAGPRIPAAGEASVPEIEVDENVAPRPEEEIADVARAQPDTTDHGHPVD